MKSQGYAVPYIGGHYTWKETAPRWGTNVFATFAIVVATALPFGCFISPGSKPRPRASMSHSGREENGHCDTCCSTPQELYGRTFRVDKLVGIQTRNSH